MASSPAHKGYNRQKYYSALRSHTQTAVTDEEIPMRESFLRAPKAVIDPNLFVYSLPGIISATSEEGGKQSSFVTIFSCWNTMLGTAIVALPWAF
jgi:hypothetical protein